jgi:threonine synthase
LNDTGSTFTHLQGALSGESYPADELMGLDPVDGRPLLARYDIEKATRTLTEESLAERRTGGLWRWAELLPVRDRTNVVYLGEGDTPLLAQPRLGRALSVPHLSTKAEGLIPSPYR